MASSSNNDYTNADAILDILIGLAFSLGVVASAIPQHINCLKAKSAEGFSLSTLLIATTCLTCRFVAALLENFDTVAAADGFLRKTSAAMPVIQVGLMILFTTPSYILYYFLWYKPPLDVVVDIDNETTSACELVEDSSAIVVEKSLSLDKTGDDTSNGNDTPPTPSRMSAADCKQKDATFTLKSLSVALSIVLISIMGLIAPETFHKEFQIKLWGAMGAILNAILWLPQVLKTYKIKSGGVLSVTMLAINSFGDLVLVGYWIKLRQSFWIWCSPIADSLMQMMLIVMICFYRKHPERARSYRYSLQQPLVSSSSEYYSSSVDEFIDNEGQGTNNNYMSVN